MAFETKSSRIAYQNPYIIVREDIFVRPDGSDGIYGVVDKPDYALILAVEDDHIWLVEQYRYPVQGRFWEIPQGAVDYGPDGAAVDPLEIAKIELKEETGLTARDWTYLGPIHEAYGFLNNTGHVFLAQGLTTGTFDPGVDELDMVVKRFSLAQFRQMMRDNVIRDAGTLAAYALWRLRAEA